MEKCTENSNEPVVIEKWMMNLWDDYSNKLDLYDIYLISRILKCQLIDGFCEIHDDVFAKELHLDIRSIGRRLKKLSDLNLIVRSTFTSKGNIGFYRIRKIYLTDTTCKYCTENQ